MAVQTDEGPLLLVKKLGGLVLVVLGFVVMATGVSSESTGLVVFGTLVLVAGAILLALKVIRRNQNSGMG
jgi:hypothetical protein